MVNAGDELFRAVCEQPWDTALRLAYADWLADHAQPQWAAFIRLQCQAPEFSLNRFQARYGLSEPFDEVGEFDPFESDWRKQLPQPPGVRWGENFKGGFFHSVGFLSPRAFKEHAATVFAASPVDMLAVGRLTDQTIQDVLSSPLLRRLEWLSTHGPLGTEGVRLLAGCPHLIRLKNLCINDSRCGDDGAEALAGSLGLGTLERLYLENHQIGNRGALALAESPNLNRVTFLAFGATGRLSQPVLDKLKKRFQWLDGWPTQG
jgi:uncharacterized protein (TIGR02996 family)